MPSESVPSRWAFTHSDTALTRTLALLDSSAMRLRIWVQNDSTDRRSASTASLTDSSDTLRTRTVIRDSSKRASLVSSLLVDSAIISLARYWMRFFFFPVSADRNHSSFSSSRASPIWCVTRWIRDDSCSTLVDMGCYGMGEMGIIINLSLSNIGNARKGMCLRNVQGRTPGAVSTRCGPVGRTNQVRRH